MTIKCIVQEANLKIPKTKTKYVGTFTESGGFVSKHLGNPLGDPGNPLLFTGRSHTLIS